MIEQAFLVDSFRPCHPLGFACPRALAGQLPKRFQAARTEIITGRRALRQRVHDGSLTEFAIRNQPVDPLGFAELSKTDRRMKSRAFRVIRTRRGRIDGFGLIRIDGRCLVASPLSPPFKMPARVRKSRPALLAPSPWHFQQCFCTIGTIARSKVSFVGEAAGAPRSEGGPAPTSRGALRISAAGIDILRVRGESRP